MVITWYGQACFRLQSGQTTVVIDPFEKKLGLTPPKFEAQIVLVTHEHFDHNNTKDIKGDPLVIDGPGEYETSGVRIRGVFSYHDDTEGSQRGVNTIYVIKMEDIRIVHLGDLGQNRLTEEQLDTLGEVDILMVPVGGIYTLDAKQATEITNQIEPKIVIPMHYKGGEKLAPVSDFLKKMDFESVIPLSKLVVKKDELGEEMKVVVLEI